MAIFSIISLFAFGLFVLLSLAGIFLLNRKSDKRNN
jgi:LPXTG-motif cell wall-anchored protein